MARKPADQSVHREDIILAAAEVLQRNGYEAATMKDIAAAVNLTAASLYHHFRNKDTLLLAVLELGLEVVTRQIEPIAASSQPSEQKLREMICAHVVGLTENTAVGAAMVFEIRALMNVKAPLKSASTEDKAAYASFIEQRSAFFKQRDHFEDLFRSVVSEGVERGTFRPLDVPIFVKTLLGAHNWVGVWYKPEGRLNGKEIAGMIADTMLNGVLTA
ncbi:MAG: TetR family transcriptional regulator [Chloroflexi bacterium]|nr:TetR family transcriptional regulator [Chloroflexota bacterium]